MKILFAWGSQHGKCVNHWMLIRWVILQRFGPLWTYSYCRIRWKSDRWKLLHKQIEEWKSEGFPNVEHQCGACPVFIFTAYHTMPTRRLYHIQLIVSGFGVINETLQNLRLWKTSDSILQHLSNDVRFWLWRCTTVRFSWH